jgi:hypothetical protein
MFLEPPHSHDPTRISHIAALSATVLTALPDAVQDALWTLQESTSVVYASYLRLQALLKEKFERLTPDDGACKLHFSLIFGFFYAGTSREAGFHCSPPKSN